MDVSSFLGGNFLTHLDLPQPYQIVCDFSDR